MRLKRALRWLHARQPWTPKPGSGAVASTRVELAWAWRLGAAGSGVAVLGEGCHSEISASPSDGSLALPLSPGFAAWYNDGLLARCRTKMCRHLAARRAGYGPGDRRPMGPPARARPDPRP